MPCQGVKPNATGRHRVWLEARRATCSRRVMSIALPRRPRTPAHGGSLRRLSQRLGMYALCACAFALLGGDILVASDRSATSETFTGRYAIPRDQQPAPAVTPVVQQDSLKALVPAPPGAATNAPWPSSTPGLLPLDAPPLFQEIDGPGGLVGDAPSEPRTVPEPGSLMLVLGGIAVYTIRRRRRIGE